MILHDVDGGNAFTSVKIAKLCDEMRKLDIDQCPDSAYVILALGNLLAQMRNEHEGE